MCLTAAERAVFALVNQHSPRRESMSGTIRGNCSLINPFASFSITLLKQSIGSVILTDSCTTWSINKVLKPRLICYKVTKAITCFRFTFVIFR